MFEDSDFTMCHYTSNNIVKYTDVCVTLNL